MFAFVGCPQVRHRQECNKKPKRALLNWLGGLDGTPQVLSLTFRGVNFRLGLKKSPRLSHGQSIGQKGLARLSQGNGAPVSGWGMCEKVFSLTAMFRVAYPVQVEGFFFRMQQEASIL